MRPLPVFIVDITKANLVVILPKAAHKLITSRDFILIYLLDVPKTKTEFGKKAFSSAGRKF